MQTLKNIEAKLAETKAENANTIEELKDIARQVFARKMKRKANAKIIDEMVKALDDSKELTGVGYDEYYHRYARADVTKLINTESELEQELLEEYLQDVHCIYVDYQNDCITTSEGPCILINHDGDVLDQDSGKWFISKKDYETEEERNKLIEAYMEKTGCFPSVIEVDYHGNAFYRSTISQK